MNESRRKFLKNLRILPLLAAGVPIVSDSIDQDPPKPRIDIRKEPEIITKEAFTPMQALVNLDPPKYDMGKVLSFFKRNYPGSEDFVPVVFEACERHAKTYHMDPLLVMSQIFQESKFDPAAISWVGAGGLMQFIPSTAERMGMKDVYHPDYYREATEKYGQAKKIQRRAELCEKLLFNEIRSDMRNYMKKRKKRATEMNDKELGEMKFELYKHWSNLKSLEDIPDLARESSEKIIFKAYEMFDKGITDLQEGLVDIVSNMDFVSIREAYEEASERMEHLLDDFSVFQEYHELMLEKARYGSNFMDLAFESALEREQYKEMEGDVKKDYRKYRGELIAGKIKEDQRFKPEVNTDMGVKYNAQLTRRLGGNVLHGMCAFNCGVDNVEIEIENPRTGKKFKVFRIPFFRETVNYWDKIYSKFNQWYLSIV
ncbi:MAG: transglycosylase SLT domain-containing protein [Candidatus Aenigmarchaeota archaeon]|nr:transglycosylase SLT domain-containing protein [Candidatus Aenigmarchaeota archaeon]NIP40527.1 transglycosylase SLT domain-containing protein [Candidatus Aenigmarchaeota archaeon]NIQ18372.1 transglycosylase SLT domain-containing protein [Candidatus Aenigmarchaeota archaeon]